MWHWHYKIGVKLLSYAKLWYMKCEAPKKKREIMGQILPANGRITEAPLKEIRLYKKR